MNNIEPICSVVGCKNTVPKTTGEFDVKASGLINIRLCPYCHNKYAHLLNAKGSFFPKIAMPGYLNVGGVIANALRNYLTPDPSKNLAASLTLMDNATDHELKINEVLADAAGQTVDLFPGGDESIKAFMSSSGWWADFFKVTKLNDKNSRLEVYKYVANNVQNIRSESVLKKIANTLSTKPDSKFGKKKNTLVAKLALTAASKIYDRNIDKALARTGLSRDNLPEISNIFMAHLAPILQRNGTITALDIRNISRSSKIPEKALSDTYNAIRTIQNYLKTLGRA